MTKNQYAKSQAKTAAAIKEMQESIIRYNCAAARAVTERIRPTLIKKSRFEILQEIETKMFEIEEEISRLEKRYSVGLENSMQFSDLSVRQFEKDPGTNGILAKIQELNKEWQALQDSKPKMISPFRKRNDAPSTMTQEDRSRYRVVMSKLSDEEFEAYLRNVRWNPEQIEGLYEKYYRCQMSVLCKSFDFKETEEGGKFWSAIADRI